MKAARTDPSACLTQAGVRYALVVQSDLLPLSTWLVAPTSTAARELDDVTTSATAELGGVHVDAHDHPLAADPGDLLR